MTIRTDEELLKEANQYININELRRKNGSLYCLLLKRKLLAQTGLAYTRRQWNDKNVKAEATHYKTRLAFQQGSKGAYNYALRHNLLEEFFPK